MFYGSQTGTAEEYAARLAKEATRHGLPGMTYDPEECSDWVCVCVCVYVYVSFAVPLAHPSPISPFLPPPPSFSQNDLVNMGSEIENSLAIFCVATYGEGDPTDNAVELHTWLSDQTPETDCSSLK